MSKLPVGRKDYVSTYSGAEFNIQTCDVMPIPMSDVAHALSMNCRYNGHVNKFYSVAEHCVIISNLVPEEDALWGLLHDATEAFVPDIPRPFKPFIKGFKEYEQRISDAFAERFGLSKQQPESVHYMDRNIVHDEALELFPEPPTWVELYESVGAGDMIKCLTPEKAEKAYNERLEALIW